MKIYFIILDGAADRKIRELDGKTPLEYAKTCALDSLAKKGCQSMITVIDDEIAPESDSGTMALLSYEPKVYYPGRGTLEGIGAGFTKGYKYSASFRINFASYDLKRNLLDRRTARNISDEELQQLAEELRTNIRLDEKGQIQVRLKAFGHHRGILTFISDEIELSGNVSNTDPGFRKVGCFSIPISGYEKKPQSCNALDDTYSAAITAHYVNEFVNQSRKILANSQVNYVRIEKGMLPANCVLVRDGGVAPKKLQAFFEKFQWSLSIYGQLPSEKAIAELIGAKFYYTKALELQLDEQYLSQMAQKLINCNHDVIYIHLKGPDEPGHDHDPWKKVEAIEKIDYFFVQELIKGLTPDDLVIVTCDHATPCELGIHSSDRVPLLMCGPRISADKRVKFSEKDAFLGEGKITRAIDILPFIKKLEK